MKVRSGTEKYQKTPKTEVTITKKAKVPIFFRPTVLHDHAASRLVKKEELQSFIPGNVESNLPLLQPQRHGLTRHLQPPPPPPLFLRCQ